MAGGVCKYVPLRLNDAKTTWDLDMDELEAAITPKTKLMIINTPHNVCILCVYVYYVCVCVCMIVCV